MPKVTRITEISNGVTTIIIKQEPTRYCLRCNTLETHCDSCHFCSYCLQLPLVDFEKPITQSEIEGLRW